MYRIDSLTATTITIDRAGYVNNILTPNVLSITGSASGNLVKYKPAIVKQAYMGGVSTGLLHIRITLESNAVTEDPVTARFIVELAKEIAVPFAKIEILKITL